MACTRAKNMSGNYCLEQKGIQHIMDYGLYNHSSYGHAVHPAIPDIGITPSHMPRNTLSTNPVEIETELFGIGSCNLVDPKKPVQPKLQQVPEMVFFTRVPLIRPKQFVPDTNQRPFPIPE
tara:strand:- start:601 stop:963 length:363 start_codon:yes stop_codon:yes gene_type:complete